MSLDLKFHGMLLADTYRMRQYKKAISRVIRKGDVVLDIGAGTGILSFFACQAHAKRVYAIERTDTIHLAEELAKENGFSQKIVFLKQDIQDVLLPGKVDVIISELISNFGLGENILKIVHDTKKRLLKPNGRCIPQTLKMHFVPVEATASYKKILFGQEKSGQAFFSLDFSAYRQMAVNEIYKIRFSPATYLAQETRIFSFDFLDTIPSGILNNAVSFSVLRKGILHGFCGYFSASLAAGVNLTNKPPCLSTAWTNLFFPLEEPVVVRRGDQIMVGLTAVEKEDTVFYRWKTSIIPAKSNKRLRETQFDQTNRIGDFFGMSIFSKRA